MQELFHEGKCCKHRISFLLSLLCMEVTVSAENRTAAPALTAMEQGTLSFSRSEILLFVPFHGASCGMQALIHKGNCCKHRISSCL